MSSKNKNLLMVVLSCFWIFFTNIPCGATTAMQNVTGGGAINNGEGSGATWGWAFTAGSNVNILSLGMYDYGGDGLMNSHNIGLWDFNGSLLASALIPAGTGSTLEQGYRYAPLTTPITITPGNYVVGVHYLPIDDMFLWSHAQITPPLTFNMAPEITYLVRRGTPAYSPDLEFPSWVGNGDSGYFGPNFQYGPVGGGTIAPNVPEPSPFLLLGAGIGSLALLRRKARKQ